MVARISFAVVVAVVAGVVIYLQYDTPTFHTDFGVSWFGARAMLDGVNPYPLVGKGKPFNYNWPLVYPATAFVPLLPLAVFSEKVAAVTFTALSAGVLAFGVTRRGWHLLPMFCTEPFLNSVRLGQWSLILTAALFIPWLSVLAVVKPQAGIPAILGNRDRGAWMWGLLGGGILLFISAILIPGWIGDWVPIARSLTGMTPPLLRPGGFMVLLALFKWRERDAWLVLSMAAVPQTAAFYGVLPLFTIPKTFYQSVMLAALVTLGGWGSVFFAPQFHSVGEIGRYLGTLLNFTVYLPCVAMLFIPKSQESAG